MPPKLSRRLDDNHIICVGAVYIDTILTVPHFPHEDSKLRAKKLTRRRGGNTANTLEVLSQLIKHDPSPSSGHKWIFQDPGTWLSLLTVLPRFCSDAARFIEESLPSVDLRSSIYRTDHEDAASSYIIQSEATLSRTIVSMNQLPEMTVDEFKEKIELSNTCKSSHMSQTHWVHFEGRVPEVTLECVWYLHRKNPSFKVSVECEKPEREGMVEVARLADVVFYSKLWAETNGFSDAKTFLEAQLQNTQGGAMLCCTWGAAGATVVQKDQTAGEKWADVGVWKPTEGEKEVVDTIGAGDTFIAGLLFAINKHADWPLQRQLEFANELAGRKVLQDGFADLGRKMW